MLLAARASWCSSHLQLYLSQRKHLVNFPRYFRLRPRSFCVRKTQQLNPKRFSTHRRPSQVEIDMKIRFKPEPWLPRPHPPGAGLSPDPGASLFWSFACDKLLHVAWHSWLLLLAMGKSTVWPSKSLWPPFYFELQLKLGNLAQMQCTAGLALSVAFSLFAARQVCVPANTNLISFFNANFRQPLSYEFSCMWIEIFPHKLSLANALTFGGVAGSDFCGFNFAAWRMKFPLLFLRFSILFVFPRAWVWTGQKKNVEICVLYWLDLILG